MDGRPIGVFDSGMGGLTVLHECLVTMPHEDFVYLGDGARLPYGPRPLDEVRRFALEIGVFLETQGVKMVLAACNTATSAALPDLQEALGVPVVGVITPEAHAAVQATRNRRIGLLATEGTVEAGRYERLVHTLDASVRFVPLACPRLVPLIESDDPFGAATVDAVREYAAPLKDEDVDTVILGCTHYPLVRNIFQRVFGRERDARVLSRRDGARGRRHARAQGDRERRGARGRVPLPDDGLDRDVPRDRRALPAAADRRGRARRAGRARGGGMREGRRPDELRPLAIELDYLEQPHGAVLFSQGKTKVLCTAMIEDEIPRWLKNSGRGWMTAEYSLLPASTGERVQREVSRGRAGGRTVEIQRLIGRALRSVVDFEALGERTVWLDCDVLQADGGTRCAAISGAFVAARRALDRFGLSRALADSVAAVSVGIVDGEPRLDLEYTEDSTAEVDMNVVMTGDGRLVEVQATAEGAPFTRELLDDLLELSRVGIERIAEAQERAFDA